MIKSWNEIMAAIFTSGWITYMDAFVLIWTNKWKCPGWILCTRKPHPIRKNYLFICCGICGIMFTIELVKGNIRTKELPSDTRTKTTTNLLLSLYKSLYSAGKVVILYNGFCALKGLIVFRKFGVFGGALIKKRRY